MKRILVAYCSREGQTEKIAHHIARKLEERGHGTRLINLKKGETEAGSEDCDGAIVAGSIHRGRHDPELSGFIMRHGHALRGGHTAFVCVSLSAASLDPHDRAAIQEVANSFLYEVGWHPDVIEHVAGAVRERQLNLIDRYTVHAAMYQKSIEADPTGDTELTDWAALDRFIVAYSEHLNPAAAVQTA